MTYLEALELKHKKNQEFIEYCDKNGIESVYGLTPEEEKILENKFNSAGVYNTNSLVHQNYQNYRVIELLSGLFFVPMGLMACGDMEVLTQLPVTEELMNSNLWSVKSINITNIDW